MEVLDSNPNLPRQRHGCVTAWLILMLIGGAVTSLIYFFAGNLIQQSLPVEIPTYMMIILGVLGIANVVFAVLLLQWKKIAFWGFIGTSLIATVINIYIGLGIGQSLSGLIGIAILYGILQIKQNGVSAWDNLE